MSNSLYEELNTNSNKKQKNVNINKNIVKISKNVFQGNLYLTKISFNDKIQVIEEEAFKECGNLKKVYFPIKAKVRNIPRSCFEDCTNLEYFSIPKSVSVINSKAFANCTSIKVLTIPAGVNIVDSDAFEGWNDGQEIVVYKDYGDFINCDAKITQLYESNIENQESIKNKEEGNRYFAVTCKCGHVSRNYYIPIKFAIIASNRKDAAAKARQIGRVKHNHKYAIITNEEISFTEYLKIKEENSKDPYLNVKSKHEQKEIIHLIKHRLIPEVSKAISKENKETGKKYYDGKTIIRNLKKYII